MGSKILKILVVDDDLFFRESIIRILAYRFPDFEVEESTDGVNAYAKAEGAFESKRPFDCIITDRNMSRMGGDELSGKIRELDTSVKIIMMSTRLPIQKMSNVNHLIKKDIDFTYALIEILRSMIEAE